MAETLAIHQEYDLSRTTADSLRTALRQEWANHNPTVPTADEVRTLIPLFSLIGFTDDKDLFGPSTRLMAALLDTDAGISAIVAGPWATMNYLTSLGYTFVTAGGWDSDGKELPHDPIDPVSANNYFEAFREAVDVMDAGKSDRETVVYRPNATSFHEPYTTTIRKEYAVIGAKVAGGVAGLGLVSYLLYKGAKALARSA